MSLGEATDLIHKAGQGDGRTSHWPLTGSWEIPSSSSKSGRCGYPTRGLEVGNVGPELISVLEPREMWKPASGSAPEKLSHPSLIVCMSVAGYFLFEPQFPYLSDGANMGTCRGRTPAHAGAPQRENGMACLSLRRKRALGLSCHFKQYLCPCLHLTMFWQIEMSALRSWDPCYPP